MEYSEWINPNSASYKFSNSAAQIEIYQYFYEGKWELANYNLLLSSLNDRPNLIWTEILITRAVKMMDFIQDEMDRKRENYRPISDPLGYLSDD